MLDLRSDTVTRPSPAMREAMASAPVGDDVYGDDPTMNELEARVAALFGKEAGLFTPTGSLSNQLGIRTLVKPGQELITETFSHIVRAELGAGATFSGITTRTWRDRFGKLDADNALSIAHPNAGPYLVSTAAIAIENTHNFGGGTVQEIAELQKVSADAQAMGLKTHLDGARIWNAHVKTGIALAEYGRLFDTVSVCFSKGLGAPIGSMLLSTKENISEARVWRKRYGAGMRQVGVLAAAVNYALDHNIELLSYDHLQAQKIWKSIAAVDNRFVYPCETNIVVMDLTSANYLAASFVSQLKDRGVLASALGAHVVRFVTHMDLSDEDIALAIEEIGSLIQNVL